MHLRIWTSLVFWCLGGVLGPWTLTVLSVKRNNWAVAVSFEYGGEGCANIIHRPRDIPAFLRLEKRGQKVMSPDLFVLKLRVVVDLGVDGPESLADRVDVFGYCIRVWAGLVVGGLPRREGMCCSLAKGTENYCTLANHCRSHVLSRVKAKHRL